MRFKLLVSLTMILSLFACAVTAFADEASYTLGTPIDLTDNKATSDLVEGHYIAIPVDVTSATGFLTGFSFSVDYTDMYDYLEAGITNSEIMGNSTLNNNLKALGSLVNFSPMSPTDKCKGIDACGMMYDNTFYPAGGTSTVTLDHSEFGAGTHAYTYLWYHATTHYQYTDNPEVYLLFKVKKSVDDLDLNSDIFKFLVNSDSHLSDTLTDDYGVGNVPGTVPKINACAGAFKVTIDGSKVNNMWIKGVYAQQKDNTDKHTPLYPVEIKGDTDIYEFPARVNIPADSSKTSENEVTFEIYAETSDTKGGLATDIAKIGEVTVKLDGTVTSYAANSVSNAQ